MSDGTAWAGEIMVKASWGDGTATQRNTPVQVSGLTGVTAIACGAYSPLAVKSDGTCGRGDIIVYGRLGDGTTTNRTTPVQVNIILYTDATPPTVASTNPANNATDVAINSTITATFSETMNAGTIGSNTFSLMTGSTTVSGAVSYSGSTATFTPSSGLAYSTTYTATITNGVRDVAGNAMASNYSWSFTTTNTPTGSNVVVSPHNNIMMTFTNVSSAGNTNVTTSSTGPALPAGYTAGSQPTYYDITTTATYTPPLTVCIAYGASQYGNVNNIHILHYENNAWVDATTSGNTGTHEVCGEVNSLSPFIVESTAPANTAPVANAGAGQSVNVGSTVALNGSASSDPDGDAITYSWSISSRPVNSTATLTNPTSVNPTFVADKAGAYMVSLTVSDGTLTNTAAVSITTINRSPVANAGAGNR